MACLRYKFKEKLNDSVATYEYIDLFNIKGGYFFLTLLIAVYRNLTDQISLMNIRVRVTCSNIVLSSILK
jgi:hypothetical protein